MKYHSLFSGKYKKSSVDLSSTRFAQRVLRVNIIEAVLLWDHLKP